MLVYFLLLYNAPEGWYFIKRISWLTAMVSGRSQNPGILVKAPWVCHNFVEKRKGTIHVPKGPYSWRGLNIKQCTVCVYVHDHVCLGVFVQLCIHM